jgi:hypothetical protein
LRRIFRDVRRLGRPDLALIPIGSYAPRWFMSAQHTNPNEAVQVLEVLEPPAQSGFTGVSSSSLASVGTNRSSCPSKASRVY